MKKINISQIDQRLSEDSFHYAAYKLKKLKIQYIALKASICI